MRFGQSAVCGHPDWRLGAPIAKKTIRGPSTASARTLGMTACVGLDQRQMTKLLPGIVASQTETVPTQRAMDVTCCATGEDYSATDERHCTPAGSKVTLPRACRRHPRAGVPGLDAPLFEPRHGGGCHRYQAHHGWGAVWLAPLSGQRAPV